MPHGLLVIGNLGKAMSCKLYGFYKGTCQDDRHKDQQKNTRGRKVPRLVISVTLTAYQSFSMISVVLQEELNSWARTNACE